MAGIDFQTEIARAEELAGGGWTPRELCLLNAERKAVEVASRFPDCVVLGADTVVSLEGQVFGKPGDSTKRVPCWNGFVVEFTKC